MTVCWELLGPWIPPLTPSKGPAGPRMPPGPLGRGCGGTLVLFGLVVVAVGCWVFKASWRKYQLRQHTSVLATRACELTAEIEPGTIVWIEGQIVGGVVVEPAAVGEVARYSDHLLVEDNRGRVARLGVPGRDEVPGIHRAGDVVFAVGELAPRGDGAAFRSPQEIDMLTRGSAQILWVGEGDRAVALRTLQRGFVRTCGEGPAMVLAGVVLALSGAFLGC